MNFMSTYVHAVDACGHDLSSHTLYMYYKVRVDSLCDKNFGIFSLNMLSIWSHRAIKFVNIFNMLVFASKVYYIIKYLLSISF